MVKLFRHTRGKFLSLLLMAFIALNAEVAMSSAALTRVSSVVTAKNNSIREPAAQNPVRIDTAGLRILPPSSGIQFIGNRILFLAHSRMEGKMISPHVSFGKIQAYSALPGELALAGTNIFSPAREFPYPPDAVTISKDLKRLYFTAKPSRRKPEQIFEAAVRLSASGQIEWEGREKPLSFCDNKNIFTHPALSSDGSFMVFSSDMSGTIGGMDIFISFREGDSWSDPRNLGAEINSEGDELYPFLDHMNNLYFSSDKTGGSGGFDIYVAVLDGQNWFRAVSLTEPVNTSNDEIAFRIDNINRTTAFFTVRDRTGTNEMQLMKMVPDPAAYPPDGQDLSAIVTMMMTEDGGPGEKQVAYTLSRPVESPALALVEEPELHEPEISEVQEVSEKAEATEPVRLPEKDKKEENETDIPLMHLPIAEVKLPPEPEEKTAKAAGIPARDRNAPEVRISSETRKSEENAIYLTSSREVIEGVIYRVQFSASMTPKESIEVTIEGRRYNTFGYFYGGAYRTTVGEFNTLAEARTLQNTMRKLGYNQAFVVAFRNGERINYYLNKDTY